MKLQNSYRIFLMVILSLSLSYCGGSSETEGGAQFDKAFEEEVVEVDIIEKDSPIKKEDQNQTDHSSLNAPSIEFYNSVDGIIAFEWSDLNDDEEAYQIVYRDLQGSEFQTLVELPANRTQYVATPAFPDGSAYVFKVLAIKGDEQADSIPMNITFNASTGALPQKPTQLLASAVEVNGECEIRLNWFDKSINEMGFEVEKVHYESHEDGNDFEDGQEYAVTKMFKYFSNPSEIGSLALRSMTITDASGDWIELRIRAFNPAGNSAYTSYVSLLSCF